MAPFDERKRGGEGVPDQVGGGGDKMPPDLKMGSELHNCDQPRVFGIPPVGCQIENRPGLPPPLFNFLKKKIFFASEQIRALLLSR